MRPIDSVTQREWAWESCSIVLGKIRDDVNAELRARDASHGIPQEEDRIDENGVKIGVVPSYKVYTVDDKGHSVVDQHLASLKHKGHERRLLVKRRWAQLCSQPRDEVALTANAGLTVREKQLAQMLEDTAKFEASDPPLGPVKSTPPETMTTDDPADVSVVEAVTKQYPCDQCGRTFKHQGHLTNHQKTHKRELVSV